MSALFKRVGLVLVAFDLLVGVASAAVLHRHAPAASHGAAMSAARLERVLEASAPNVRASCSADRNAGWDYYCVSSDGSRALYDVSAGGVTQRLDLPSWR